MGGERRLVTILRHGESEYNVKKKIAGITDVPLTQVGEEQARSVSSLLQLPPDVVVWSSDLERTSRTGELASSVPRDKIKRTSLLRERNYGRFEGGGVTSELLAFWGTDHGIRLDVRPDPLMETDRELLGRWEEFDSLLHRQPEPHILVVTHEDAMVTVLRHLGLTRVENTGFVTLEGVQGMPLHKFKRVEPSGGIIFEAQPEGLEARC
jgi:broad specificity phosphatase PhoE